MPSPSFRMGRAGAGAWRAHDATPPGHDAPRRRAVQHHGDRRAALADDGRSHRAGEPRAVGDRDGDFLPAVGDGGARARRHRPRGRGHLSLGHPGVRPASRVSRRLGLLGEQPRLLPVAPAHEWRDRGLRRGAGVRAPRREQVVHRRVFARQPVDRGGAEPSWAAGGQVGAEPGRVRHLAAGGDLRAARPLVVRDARQRDAVHGGGARAGTPRSPAPLAVRHHDVRVRRARAGADAGRRDPGPGGDAAARHRALRDRRRGDVRARDRRDARGAPRRDGERHQRDAAGDRHARRATRRPLARARGRPRRPPADARQPRGRGRVDRRDGPDSLRRRGGSRAPARLRQGAPALADALRGSAGAGWGRHRVRRGGARRLDRARRVPPPRGYDDRAVLYPPPLPLRRLPPSAARAHAAPAGGGGGGARRGGALPPGGHAQGRRAPRREIPGLDFSPNGVWRTRAREVRRYRAALLSQRAFSMLNAPLAAGAPLALPRTPQASPPQVVSGVLKVPAIMLQFKDVAAQHVRSEYDQVLFASPTPPLGRPYTYRTYYQELSNGLLDIQGQTYGPATLANNEVAYTGTPPCSGNPISGNANCNGLFTNSQIPDPFTRMQNGLREALQNLEAGIDFSQYDADGDGYVDLVAFIQPAQDGACGGQMNNHAWSHRSSLDFVTTQGNPSHPNPSDPLHFFRVRGYILESGLGGVTGCDVTQIMRSEERRVGKECRSRWSPYH